MALITFLMIKWTRFSLRQEADCLFEPDLARFFRIPGPLMNKIEKKCNFL